MNKSHIVKSHGLKSEILVCKVCKKPVEKGFTTGNVVFYSCLFCDSWVSNVEWVDNTAKS
jgi:hypothetical protein